MIEIMAIDFEKSLASLSLKFNRNNPDILILLIRGLIHSPSTSSHLTLAYVIEQVDANQMIIELTCLFCPCLDRPDTHVNDKWRLLVGIYVLYRQFATKHRTWNTTETRVRLGYELLFSQQWISLKADTQSKYLKANITNKDCANKDEV